MTPARAHDAHLARAEQLIDEAGRLLAAQRPLLVAAALTGESAPFPVWALDRDHRLLWANREFEVKFGISLMERRGQTLAEIFGRRNQDLAIDDEVVMATAHARSYHAPIGGIQRQRVLKWALHGEGGEVIGLCGAMP